MLFLLMLLTKLWHDNTCPRVTMPSTSVRLPPLLWYPSPQIANPPPSTFPRPPQSTSSPHAQLPSPPSSPPSSPVHPNRLIAPSCRHYHLLCIVNSPPPPPPAPRPPSPPLPSPLHLLLESSVTSRSCSTIASSAALVPSSTKIETASKLKQKLIELNK